MRKLQWKFLAVALAVLGVAGGGLFYLTPSSDAALSFPRPGFINPCAGFKDHPILSNIGPDFDTHTDGGIIVEVGTHFVTSDSRNGANLIIRELRSTGEVDGIGKVEIGFDAAASRRARSTIVANQKGADYPATQTMSFFPTVTIDGKKFQAMNAAKLVNSEVTSTPPKEGTVYSLTNDVALEDAENPGKVAMTIKPGRAFTVTGHDFK